MGKITGWRSGDETCKSDIDKLRDNIKEKSIEKYGRSDVPSYVQRAAESYALRKRVSNRKALESLIAEVGSFEVLVNQLSKEHRKTTKKINKAAKQKIEAAQKPKFPPSPFQRAVDASKCSKYISIVLGGAPGLGKKA